MVIVDDRNTLNGKGNVYIFITICSGCSNLRLGKVSYRVQVLIVGGYIPGEANQTHYQVKHETLFLCLRIHSCEAGSRIF